MANLIEVAVPTLYDMYYWRWYADVGWMRDVTFGPVELNLPQGGKCPVAWRMKCK